MFRKAGVALIVILLTIHVYAQKKTGLLIAAETTLSNGDTTLAVKQFREILFVYPQSFVATKRLAEIYTSMEDYHQAMLYCNIALDITDNYQTQSEAQITPSHKPDQQDLKKEKERIKHYENDRADIHHLKGQIRIKQQRDEDAIEEFQKSLEIRKNGEVMISLALAYLNKGYSRDAIQLLQETKAMEPDNYKACFNLANVYYKLQQMDSALYYYEKTIALEPDYKWPYLYRGLIYTQNEAYEKAVSSYNNYLKQDSINQEVLFRRAVLFSELRQWGQAINDWQKVLLLNPQNADAWRNRGLSYFQMAKYDSAIASFNQALALQPEEAYTYINRGYSYYLINQPKEALEDINRGLKDLPKYYLGYYFRALTYLQLGNKKKACKDAGKAISLGMKETNMDAKLIKKCF